MSFSFTCILLVTYILFFFFLSYKWMESVKRYQTTLRIFWGIFYTICFFWLVPIFPEKNVLGDILIYIILGVPLIYSILFSYTSLSLYSKYMDEGIYSLSVFFIIIFWLSMIAGIWDYNYDSTWEDLQFLRFSTFWIFTHIPFFISSKNRKWFFHRFYIFPIVVMSINLLFICNTSYDIIFLSYSIFFIMYIIAISIGKYIETSWKK